jgi:hypothetical protein
VRTQSLSFCVKNGDGPSFFCIRNYLPVGPRLFKAERTISCVFPTYLLHSLSHFSPVLLRMLFLHLSPVPERVTLSGSHAGCISMGAFSFPFFIRLYTVSHAISPFFFSSPLTDSFFVSSSFTACCVLWRCCFLFSVCFSCVVVYGAGNGCVGF